MIIKLATLILVSCACVAFSAINEAQQEREDFIAIDFFPTSIDDQQQPENEEIEQTLKKKDEIIVFGGDFENQDENEDENDQQDQPFPNPNLEKRLFGELPTLKQANHTLRMSDYFHFWHNFKIEYGRLYETYEEEKQRFLNYIANFEHVRLHNIAYKLGIKTYSTKMNQFSDMTHEEFVKTMNGYKRNLMGDDTLPKTHFREPLHYTLPDKVDWRDEGYVTPVKNQGHCGSCWAFSATGSLEGQHMRKSGTLVSLSEQNLVDCSSKFGNEGCSGGLMDQAFQYIKQNKGIDTESSYPYEAKDGKCRFKKASIGADDIGFVDVQSGNETALQMALASQGPISVAIDAGHKSFQFYEKGVYFEPKCSCEQLDHGVLAVGYGTTEDGADYWIVKNSWGTTWGEGGYVKIARNRDNHCGVATQASYPSV